MLYSSRSTCWLNRGIRRTDRGWEGGGSYDFRELVRAKTVRSRVKRENTCLSLKREKARRAKWLWGLNKNAWVGDLGKGGDLSGRHAKDD